jgi:hypothetical protein
MEVRTSGIAAVSEESENSSSPHVIMEAHFNASIL